jgi:hypothetical protein
MSLPTKLGGDEHLEVDGDLLVRLSDLRKTPELFGCADSRGYFYVFILSIILFCLNLIFVLLQFLWHLGLFCFYLHSSGAAGWRGTHQSRMATDCGESEENRS